MVGRVSLTWPNYLRRTLVVDGVSHRLTPKLMELACLLVMRRGQFVPIPEIIEVLWPDPDEEPDFSEDVIRTYASRLRRCLPKGAIIARATTCTDRMEPGHYLPGALMLVKDDCLPKLKVKRVRKPREIWPPPRLYWQQLKMFDDLPLHPKPPRNPLPATRPMAAGIVGRQLDAFPLAA